LADAGDFFSHLLVADDEHGVEAGRVRRNVRAAGPHNFRNSSTQKTLNFGVAYFVPVGATLLTPAPAPAACE
jgi:hypothetical protein